MENCTAVMFIFSGRGSRIRTCDLTVPNRALYQAEPCPDISMILLINATKLNILAALSRSRQANSVKNPVKIGLFH